jgi:hypothetical protein
MRLERCGLAQRLVERLLRLLAQRLEGRALRAGHGLVAGDLVGGFLLHVGLLGHGCLAPLVLRTLAARHKA